LAAVEQKRKGEQREFREQRVSLVEVEGKKTHSLFFFNHFFLLSLFP